ncbi:MAG: hypothetical protein K8S97_09705, partial [Anaerolineae bacterium]|nr:hypothetical protein [Anaerolineae bacterium]
MRTRKQAFVIVFVLLAAFVMMALGPVEAATYPTPSIHMDNVTFDACDATSFTLSYDIHHDYTGAEGTLTHSSYWYVNGALAVTEYTGVPLNSPGVVAPWNFTFGSYGPEVATYTFEQLWQTYLDGVLVFENRVPGTCIYSAGWTPGAFNVYHIEIAPDEPAEPVPGCDVTITIPSTAVGATITADTPVYWAPGEVSTETFPAGLSLRALGVDDSG